MSTFSPSLSLVPSQRSSIFRGFGSQTQTHTSNQLHFRSHGFSLLTVSLSPFSPLRPSLSCSFSSLDAAVPPTEGGISIINLEDYIGKDWSFLESGEPGSEQELGQKIDRIISSGEIGKSSRVLISIGSERFVDRLVESSPSDSSLVVAHESLLVLASIKEKHDNVKCWQGELVSMTQDWEVFDAVFLYFLPAVPSELAVVLQSLAKCCSPGARVVISHHQGRQAIAQQRKLYPDVVVSDFPDKSTLHKTAADYSFELVEFVDEPDFYLAILRRPEI